MTRRVGFTGTQEGMTQLQYDTVMKLLTGMVPLEVHHGDCVGADAQFHNIAKMLSLEVIIHPPDRDDKRAYCSQAKYIFTPKPYLERNRDIVKNSDVLIATPKTAQEEIRSGTWYTVRRAKRLGITVYIVHPDGLINKVN